MAQMMINMREAIALVEARLNEENEEEEIVLAKKRKQALVAREIEALNLKLLSLDELQATLSKRIDEAKAGSIECIVKWEIERELCWARGGNTEGSELASSMQSLEANLNEVEVWFHTKKAKVNQLRESVQKSTAVQGEAEIKRSNLTKLEKLVAKIVAPVPVGLSLNPKIEEHLVRPDEFIYQAIANGFKPENAIRDTANVAQNLRGAQNQALELFRDSDYHFDGSPVAALKERMGQIHALADAFAAGIERYCLSFFGQQTKNNRSLASLLGSNYDNDLKYRAMSVAALRTGMSHCQRELHTYAQAECEYLFEAVATLERPNSLRRLRAAFANATADLYAPQIRAYFDALEEDETGQIFSLDNEDMGGDASNPSSPRKNLRQRKKRQNSTASASSHDTIGFTHRFLEELSPVVLAEKRACDTLFRYKENTGDPCLAVQFAEMRAGALRLTERHSVGILAAVTLIECDHSIQDTPFLNELRSAVASIAQKQWENFLDQRAKWIRSAETSRKRDHGSGASSAAIELAGLTQKLEIALAAHTQSNDTNSLYRVAGPFYKKLGDAYFEWRRKAMHADTKYGILIKLENAHYLVHRFEKQDRIGGPASQLASELRTELADATRAYADWMWNYEFGKLDTYFYKLGGGNPAHNQASTFTPTHRSPSILSPTRLRISAPIDTSTPPSKLLPSLQALDDGLGKILKRLDKHFPTGSRSDPRLRLMLRRAVLDHARSIWARYDDLARTHFAQAIQPTRNQLDAICSRYNKASAGGAYATGEDTLFLDDDDDDFDHNVNHNNDIGGGSTTNTESSSTLNLTIIFSFSIMNKDVLLRTLINYARYVLLSTATDESKIQEEILSSNAVRVE